MERHFPQTLSEYMQAFLRWRRLFTWSFVIVISVVGTVYPFLPKYYKSSALLTYNSEKMMETLGKAPRESLENKTHNVSIQLRSRSNLKLLREELQKAFKDGAIGKQSTSRINRRIELKTYPGNLVSVSFMDKDPRVAKEAANFLANMICEIDSKDKQWEAKNAIRFIEEQLRHYKSRIQESEKASTINKINLDLEELYQKRSLLLEKINQIEKTMVPQPFQEENPVMFKMQTNLSELQSRLRQLRLKAREDSPLVKELTDRINALESAISDEKQNGMVRMQASPLNENYISSLAELKQVNLAINSLRRNMQDLESRGSASPLKLEELSAAEREKNVNEDIYKSLLKDLGNAQIIQQQSLLMIQGSFRILEWADLPNNPAWPTPWQTGGGGLVLAFVTATGLVLLREYRDTSFRGPADIQNNAKLPLLGSIPKMDSNSPGSRFIGPHTRNAYQLDVVNQPQSLLSQRYRLLMAQLLWMARQRHIQTILVTSAIEGEGKTTTSINLALFLAGELDQRVLLVDCDGYHGTVARNLGLPQKCGLWDYLAGRAPIESVIKPTRFGHLSVITAGDAVANPSRYLNSSNMEKLLKDLRGRFNFIIMDSPPVLPVADVPILAMHADGVVLVVEARKTPRHFVLQAELLLEKTKKENMLGYVLTRAEEDFPESYYTRAYTTARGAS